MSVCTRLRQIRESKGLKAEDVAKVIGKSRQGYTNYELGNREPSIEVIVELAKFYGVTTDYLLGFSDDDKSKSNPKGKSINENEKIERIAKSFILLKQSTKEEIFNWLSEVVQTLEIEVKPLTDKQNEYVNEIKLSQQTTMETAASDGRPATDAEKKKALQIISAEEVDADEF